MNFTNSHMNTEMFQGMLNLAIDLMVENEICCYCRNKPDRPHHICSDTDLCKAYLFEGLAHESRKKGNSNVLE